MPSSILNYKSYDPHLELPDSHAHRKYELLFSPAGLPCLIISDSSSHMVAASMTIGCGSFNDPADIPGLAHLCEHLIVSGGPQTRLRQVVSSSGGAINAYTGSDQTSFAFEISSYARDNSGENTFILDAMLPVFASYFSKLKFTTASISAEIRAVHEEQTLNTSMAEKVLWHGLRLLSSETHPFSRFATGNMSTLSRAPTKILRAGLSHYHTQNFYPQNMALVIKGPQSINHLKKVVVNNFPDIGKSTSTNTNQKSQFTSHSKHGNIFDYSKENILFIKSDDCPRIRLCFPMSHNNEVTSQNAQTMLCSIIGNESVDSLCYHLKKTSQLAENVFVHTQEICKTDSVLFIDIEATNQGMKRISSVLSLIFFFLEVTFMDIPDSQLDAIIKEYQVVDQIQFKNQKVPNSSLEEIVSYSEYLQRYKRNPQHIIRGNMSFTETLKDAKAMKQLVGRFLCRERLILQIADSSFTSIYQFSEAALLISKDEYFGFEHSKLKFDFSGLQLTEVSHPKIASPVGILRTKIAALLESAPKKSSIKYRDLKAAKSLPEIWCNEDHLQIWSHENGSSEEIEVSAHIKFNEVGADAINLVGIEIMASIMGERLQFMLYNLEALGCSWGVYVNVNGEPSLMLTAAGPRDLIDQVLLLMFRELHSCLGSMDQCSYQEVKRARVLLRRTYEEYMNSSGIKLVFVMASMLFDEGLVSPESRIKALELIDIESVAQLGSHMLGSQTFTSVLVSGDVADTVLTEVKKKCTLVPRDQTLQAQHHPVASYLVPSGECYNLDVKGPPGDPLAVVFYYIQMGKRSDLGSFTMAKLIESVVSTYAFDDLRMKRNLAYGVFSGMRMFKKTFGVHITVPTGQYSCEFIVEQIEEFLETLEQIVSEYTETQFQKLVHDLIESAEEPAGDDAVTSNLFTNLQPVNGCNAQGDDDEHKVHWNNMEQILNNTYNFGGKACEEKLDMGMLENVTLGQFRRFFRRKVAVSSSHRSVVTICKNAEEMPREKYLQIICRVLLDKLAEANLEMSEDSLLKELESCRDLETLKDLNLERYFSSLGQAMRYQKFKVKLKLGGMLKKFSSKQTKTALSRTDINRKSYETLEEIQRLCRTVE
ncbi:hypothetical protein JCM33374_g3735 [Metschnikowia sp. JCM 33374]|nr:hypothetical protein JCM33374_g3735 [Metschnikowia sp. JCM 33374]